MADIVLATFNARYEHASPALRSLKANLGGLAGRAKILEFNLETGIPEALEAVLHAPQDSGQRAAALIALQRELDAVQQAVAALERA